MSAGEAPTAEDTRTDTRADYWKVYGGALLLCIVGFVIAYQFVEPAPPSRITFSAGDPDGAYFRTAEAYAAALAKHGIDVEVLPSEGSVQNLERLTDPAGNVDVALVQGGVGVPAVYSGLMSLGSVYYEPLWVFYRSALALTDLRDLRGRRIAVGAPGSGTRAVVKRLLITNGVAAAPTELLPLGGRAALQALRDGEVDAATFVISPSAEVVRDALAAPELRLLSFDRAEAYARRFRFLNRVMLPRGAVSLAADLPAMDVQMLAPAATLVARESLHPALADLLLQAAERVHSAGSLFAEPGQFPSSDLTDFPVSPEAERYYAFGPPFLQRYLPFWAATLVDRMKVLALPLLTILFPLFKIVPPFYSWRVRRRIYRWYADVRAIEMGYMDDPREQVAERGLAALNRIERELIGLKVPLGVADALYHLRTHIGFVRAELSPRDRSKAGGVSTRLATPATDLTESKRAGS